MIVTDRLEDKAAAQSAKVGNILARVAGRIFHSLAALRTTFKNRSDRSSVPPPEIYRMEKTITKNTKRIKIFTLEELMGNQIYNQKVRERRSRQLLPGTNELFGYKLKRPILLVKEEASNQWLRLKTVTPATLLM